MIIGVGLDTVTGMLIIGVGLDTVTGMLIIGVGVVDKVKLRVC